LVINQEVAPIARLVNGDKIFEIPSMDVGVFNRGRGNELNLEVSDQMLLIAVSI
jgi:hypothetical protein